MKVWNWLNGKKTVIGSVLALVVKLAPVAGIPVEVVEVLDYLSVLLLGGGLAHKFVKSV